MADMHLLVQLDHGWHTHCGVIPDPDAALIPLGLFEQYKALLCVGCQQWPQPAFLAQKRTTRGPRTSTESPRKVRASQAAEDQTYLTTGLTPLVGGRGQPMNSLEMAYYAVLRNDATVLRVWFEPCPLLLPGKVAYWPDFRCVMWDGSIRWIECKARKKTGTDRVIPRFEDDAKIKWKIAVERYSREDERFYLAIGWREAGAYRWQVTEERTHA